MTRLRFLPLERKTERWPAMSVIARVYARDRYQCRYCGERVIRTAVMRLDRPHRHDPHRFVAGRRRIWHVRR
jgi:hypothetical protein